MCQYDRAKSKILNLWEYYLTCVNMTMPRVSSQIWWKYYLTCVNMTMPRVECQICGGWRLLGMCQYDQAKSKNHVTWRKIQDLCQYDQIKNHHMEETSKDHATWRKVLDLCQYDQIKNHHIKQKATWLMSIWPSQEQKLGNMEKNSWSVSMWPNQESSYAEKLLGSCQYDQTKSKDWASIGKSTNQRSKGIRREPWISPSCSTPPSLPLLTYVCGGFFLQQCMCSSSRTRENEQSNPFVRLVTMYL